jgi:hypothetical protein
MTELTENNATPSCTMAITEGMPTGWSNANGVMFAIYQSADSVALVPPTFTELF